MLLAIKPIREGGRPYLPELIHKYKDFIFKEEGRNQVVGGMDKMLQIGLGIVIVLVIITLIIWIIFKKTMKTIIVLFALATLAAILYVLIQILPPIGSAINIPIHLRIPI